MNLFFDLDGLLLLLLVQLFIRVSTLMVPEK
jgi:hypothetical protein